MPPPLSLPEESRQAALASLRRYADEHLDAPLGALAAGALLDFILEELGPAIYNRAVAEAQERLHARVAELDLDLHRPEFPFWARTGRR